MITFEVTIERNIILATAMADGLPVSKIAKLMGASSQTVKKHFSKSLEGYSFKRKRKVYQEPYVKGVNVDTSRDDDICSRFKNGETMESIGKTYGVCRERVRQILKRYGLTRYFGGGSAMALKKAVYSRNKKLIRRNKRLMNSYGCNLEEYKFYRSMHDDYKKTPIRRFVEQRRNAALRNIEWNLTINEWWSIWDKSGKYKDRGRTKEKYVMGRIADTGGYSVDNVEIITMSKNSTDYYDVHYDEWVEKMEESNPSWNKNKSGVVVSGVRPSQDKKHSQTKPQQAD